MPDLGEQAKWALENGVLLKVPNNKKTLLGGSRDW